MIEEHWILCGGVGPGGAAGESVHSIELGKKKGKIWLDVEALMGKMAEAMPSVMHDLLEIATYVYVGDQLISRGGERSFDYAEKWHRILHYRIPVCEYDVWSDEAIRGLLEQVLGTAAGETYRFEFVAREPRDRPNFFNVHPGGEQKHEFKEVVLFSGGLDSFTGAMDEVIGHKRNICVVSHQSNSKVVSLQRELHKFIGSVCAPGLQPLHVPVLINKPKDWTHDKSQRTRSFLFAVLGAIVARYEKLNRVRFYENGITSCNLPWDGQTLQARATRSTHPRVLHELSALVTALVGEDFIFENPYFNKTKTEVVQRLVRLKQQVQIERTRSCAGSVYRNPETHCGRCSQCVERRFATIAAKCAKYDPQGIYVMNIFTDDLTKTVDKAMAAGFAGFANRVGGMTADGFAREYMQPAGEIARYVNRGNRERGISEVFELHRRHARQVNDVMEKKLKENAGKMVKGLLPDTCLIQLVTSRKHLNVRQILQAGEDGLVPAAKSGAAAGAMTKDLSNVFCMRGDRWEMRFDGGQLLHMNKLKGMEYIWALLAKPGLPIAAVDLMKPPAPETRQTNEVCDDDEVREGGGEPGELADTETVRRCRLRLVAIKGELATARKDNDAAGIERLGSEQGKIRAYIRNAVGPGGHMRGFTDDAERMRKAVANAIKTAVKRIGRVDKRLGQHLENAIVTGRQCKYQPDAAIQWDLG